MKILHIATWFPNQNNNNEALWIKRHIDSLNLFCENEVWHIRTVENSSLKYQKYKSHDAQHRLIHLPTSKWIIIELITFLQLLYFGLFFQKKIKKADVINFHIAYPALSFWKILRLFYQKPVVITEHWSAYHFNFGVEKSLSRIRNIFSYNIPVITVSNALRNDIEKFSGYNIEGHIVPNVVDSEVFNYKDLEQKNTRFFMVSQWVYPKDPFYVIYSFEKLLETDYGAKLVVGGYGKQEVEIRKVIEERNLSDSVSFIGSLSSEQIAEEMNKATAFIHISNYETFSVVCAEAVSCGCPVIASNVGGIKEFITTENGVLIDDKMTLLNGMKFLSDNKFDRETIANNASCIFSKESVGRLYFDTLKRIIDAA